MLIGRAGDAGTVLTELTGVAGNPSHLGDGESYDDLLADRSAYEDFDPSQYFGGKGFGFVRLQQLATEHLMGAR